MYLIVSVTGLILHISQHTSSVSTELYVCTSSESKCPVESAVIWILVAAAAASVVSIESVPFFPAVITIVSDAEPVMVITFPSTATSSTVRAVSVPKLVIAD